MKIKLSVSALAVRNVLCGVIFFGLGSLPARAQGWGAWTNVPLASAAARTNGFGGGEGSQEIKSMEISADGSVILFSTDAAGLWVSTNGGNSYQPSRRGLLAQGAYSVAIDPNNNTHFLLQSMKGQVQNLGLFMSTNQGQSWFQVLTNTSNPEGGPPWNIAFDPTSSDGTKSTNVYWSAPYSGDVQFDDAQLANTGPGGLWRSTNGGFSWVEVTNANKYSDCWLAVNPASGRLYLAGGTSGSAGAFYYSDNFGKTFTQSFTNTTSAVYGLTVCKAVTNYVAIACGWSIFVSTNSGQSFSQLTTTGLPTSSDHNPLARMRVSPVTTNNLSLGSQPTSTGGEYHVDHYYTTNGGATWSIPSYGYTNQPQYCATNWVHSSIDRLAALPTWHPTNAAVLFDNTQGFILQSTNSGATLNWWNNGYTSFGALGLSFNPGNSNLIAVGGSDYGSGYSIDGGYSWSWPVTGNVFQGHNGYLFSATNIFLDAGTNESQEEGPYTLYHTTNGVTGPWTHPVTADLSGMLGASGCPGYTNVAFWDSYGTTNSGANWTSHVGKVSAVMATDPTTGYLFGALYTGSTAPDQVVISRDQGATWTELFNENIAGVAAGDNAPFTSMGYDQVKQRLYFTIGSDYTSKLYYYDTNAGTATNITSRLPADPLDTEGGAATEWANCVTVDPINPSYVYAGRLDNKYAVGASVMCSTNSGTNWITLSLQPGQSGYDGGGVGCNLLYVNPFSEELWVLGNQCGLYRYTAPGTTTFKPLVDYAQVAPSKPYAPPINFSASLQGGQLQLQGAGGSNGSYRLETSTNLVDWQLVVVTNATTNAINFGVPVLGTDPQRFYRLIQP